MPSILAEIVETKEEEITELKKKMNAESAGLKPHRDRNFKRTISSVDSLSIIAEIKFASPSAGVILHDKDPLEIGLIYEKAGASAISLITDRKYFKGDPKQLPRLKSQLSLPILRKDFIIDESQITESSLLGADAVLLIARILTSRKLRKLLSCCEDLGMDALTEVHDKDDIEKANECGAGIIGINNRDLDTFRVKRSTTSELLPLIPKGVVVVSESGIQTPGHIKMLKKYSVHAALIGTAIIKSGNIEQKVNELVLAGKMDDLKERS